jgi:hypothetical protein
MLIVGQLGEKRAHFALGLLIAQGHGDKQSLLESIIERR